jgi:glutathione S-transferase
MSLEFFWGSGSCNSWRVHLALEIKKLPYEGRLLQLSKREQKTPEYLAVNPRGKVPAIRDGDFQLSESVAILLYLDRKYPEPPLFGRTAEESGLVLRWVLDLINHLEPKLDRMAIPIYRGRVETEGEAIKVAAAEVRQELTALEASLGGAPFLVGDAISAADCTALPFIQHLLRAAGKEEARPLDLRLVPLEDSYPSLAAWVERMKGLPGYDRTYPPHWR